VSSGSVAESVEEVRASGGSYHLLGASSAGDFIEYSLDVPQSGAYRLLSRGTNHPGRGIYQLFVNGESLGEPVDWYAPELVYNEATLGKVVLTAGSHILRFECSGKNESSANFKLGLDSLSMVYIGADVVTLYSEFQKLHFSEQEREDLEVAGPMADPDGDRLSNLYEYAFGLDPRLVNLDEVSLELDRVAGGERMDVRAQFPWSDGPTDLNYKVEHSANLVDWQVLPAEQVGDAYYFGVRRMDLRSSLESKEDTSSFVRLKVEASD